MDSWKEFENVQEAQDWYSKSGFNLLIDYYTEITGRPYGSGATEKNMGPVLEKLKPGFIIVYGKGHSGATTFQSSLKTEHPKLAKDMLVFSRKLTKKHGVRLFVYYSGLFDGIAGKTHPEWRSWSKADTDIPAGDGGQFRLIPICPTSRYFEDWLSVHFREIFERGDPDGIWIDGDWASAVCYCPRCKDMFRKLYGKPVDEFPDTSDTDSPLGEAWHSFTLELRHKHRAKVHNLIHQLKPACLYSSGNITFRPDLPVSLDYNSGDWFSPSNPMSSISVAMRYFSTFAIPYEAMTIDTMYAPGLKDMRSRAKMLDRIKQEGATVLANGGQWIYWTYPMPNGAFVPSLLNKALEAKKFYEERKGLFEKTKSFSPCAVVKHRLNALRNWGRTGYAAHAFTGFHYSPDIIESLHLQKDNPYSVFVVPDEPRLTQSIVKLLKEKVEEGALLISSGSTIKSPGMEALLGIKLIRENALNEGHVFLKDRTPVGICTAWDKTKPTTAETWYPLYRSWDHDNPEIENLPFTYPITGMVDEENPEEAGFPALTANRKGKGLAIHICGDPYFQLGRFGYPQIRQWFLEILERAQPEPLFRTDAPSWVETVLRKRDDTIFIHFINTNNGRDLSYVNSNDFYVDEVPEIGPFTSSIKLSGKPKRVFLEPGNKDADAKWEDGKLIFTLPRFHIHKCLVIQQ